jgi:hypothetical protein
LKKVGIGIGLFIWIILTIALFAGEAQLKFYKDQYENITTYYNQNIKIGDTNLLAHWTNDEDTSFYKSSSQVTQEHKVFCYSLNDQSLTSTFPASVNFKTLGYNSLCFVPLYSLGNYGQMPLDSSQSMTPAIRRGCNIIAEKPDLKHIGIGDLVFFARKDTYSAMHRIIEIKYYPEMCYITKGDNNFYDDGCTLPNEITGKVVAIVC